MHSLNLVSGSQQQRTQTIPTPKQPGSGHHSPGLWQHPDDRSSNFNNVEHWIDLAQLMEAAKFHGIFIADVLGTMVEPSLSIIDEPADVCLQEATTYIKGQKICRQPYVLVLNGLFTNRYR